MHLTASFGGQALALGIGIAGGGLANLLGTPLPWMLGPMIANALVAVMGVPVVGPARLRPFIIPILGVLLGSGITPETVGQLGRWALTLVVLPMFLVLAGAVSYTVYRRIGGYDRTTAFYSAMPGGLNEMLLLGAEAGGNERQIAMAHASRVMLVIVFVAVFFGLFLGVSSTGENATPWIALDDITLRDYVLLGACAIVGYILGKRLGLPAAPVLGPMILSAATHVTGLVTVAPPTLLVIAAQLTIGTIIGTRFLGATMGEIRRDMGLSVVATFLMLLVAVAFAEGIYLASAIPLTQGFLAYAPGGLAEMSLLALAMDQDATYVSSMHIIRITIVIAVAPYVFRAFARRSE
jgi:membrane AbrB-like protein